MASATDEYVPTMVVLGDSLSAGTQDASTVGERQEMAYASQLARAAGVPFQNPRISEPGLPFRVFGGGAVDEGNMDRVRGLLEASLAPLAAWTYYLGVPPFAYPAVWDLLGLGVREPDSRSSPSRPQHNFAISGTEARQLTSLSTARDFLAEIHERTASFTEVGNQVPLIRAVLQNGGTAKLGSQVDQAIAARPDLVVLWAGSNDALEAAFRGYLDDRTLTPLEDRAWTFRDEDPLGKIRTRTTDGVLPGFRSSMTGPRGALTRLVQETRAEILVGTIPNVGEIPNFVPLGRPVGPLPFRVVLKDGTDVTGELEKLVLPTGVEGPGKGGRRTFPEGTVVPLMTMLNRFTARGRSESSWQFHEALQEVRTRGWFAEDEVLDPEEQDLVRQRVREYNDVLRDAAAGNPRIHLVDLAEEIRQAQVQGRPLRGAGPPITVTTTYTGVQDARGYEGMFSFDGVHPSDTGHAVLANVMLDYVKTHFPGDPRFARFLQAPEVDEKAVFARDPHRRPAVLVLDGARVQQLRSAAL